MTDREIPFKNRWTAGILAYLIPGAGHLYQGRLFKGVLYSVCIIGTFLYGMHLAEWRAVYFSQAPGKRNFGFFAQIGVGAPSLLALVQARRYQSPENMAASRLEEPISAEFEGMVFDLAEDTRSVPAGEFLRALGMVHDGRGADHEHVRPAGYLSGRIELEPFHGTFRGTFTGTRSTDEGDAEPVELQLGNAIGLEEPIQADARRQLLCEVVDGRRTTGAIAGTVPRSFWNWFEVPPDDEILQSLNGRLGKQFELALVFTWIAGLLNILAVWDAVEGPAYGFGDEEPRNTGPAKDAAAGEAANAARETAATVSADRPEARQDVSPGETPPREQSSAEGASAAAVAESHTTALREDQRPRPKEPTTRTATEGVPST